MKMGLADNLKDLLNLEDMPYPDPNSDSSSPSEEKSMVVVQSPELITVPESSNKDEELENDLGVAKKVTYDVFNQTNVAIAHLMKISTQNESPRGFEVVNMMLKTMSDAAAQLINLHERAENVLEKRAKRVKSDESSTSIGVQNNTIIVTPADLLKRKADFKPVDIKI